MNNWIRDEDRLKQSIKTILHAINEIENPVELSAYKKFFQKNVPLTRRTYVAAFLLKHGGIPQNLRTARTKNTRDTSFRKNENVKRLFLNVGKQQQITPKILRELFEKVQSIERNDIKNIAIHKNFAFVSLHSTKVEDAIMALDGTELNGKKLSVTMARRQK